MRYLFIVALLGVSAAAQRPPNCTGAGLDADVRCACVRDPSSKLCEMVRSGFYDPHKKSNFAPVIANWSSPTASSRQVVRSAQPAQPQQARVVPLAHKDYLRFIHPNAHFAVGFDFAKLLSMPEVMTSLLGKADRPGVIAAIKEMDHMWISFAGPADLLILMTGKFEHGAAANLFYAQGIRPVFLGGSSAMMIGPESSIQGALTRFTKPPVTGGWVARRARELSKDCETWIATEPPAGSNQSEALRMVKQFALGLRVAGGGSAEGDVVAESEAAAEQIVKWVEDSKNRNPELIALHLERRASTLRFAFRGNPAATNTNDTAMQSDFGAEVYALITAGYPGMPARVASTGKLRAVTIGMSRTEVLALLGKPLSVSAIQGMEVSRETWTYQIPFGKQVTLRLEDGKVTVMPAL